MDMEMEGPIDDLEALVADEDDAVLALAAPTAECTDAGPTC
jgi:hypothetical protein